MKAFTLKLSIIFIGMCSAQGQNFYSNPAFKQTAPDDIIEVEGNEVAFKMMNLCGWDLIFGFSETIDRQAHFISTWGNNIFSTLDSFESPSIINGVAAERLNEVAKVFYSSNDTLYFKQYLIPHNNPPQITAQSSIYIPEIISIIGGYSKLIVHKPADSIRILKLGSGSSISIVDTFYLAIDSILRIEFESGNERYNITGLDSDGKLHTY